MYAIVETSGRQYKVTVGKDLVIDKISSAPNKEILLDKVVFISDNERKLFGTPYINGAVVKAKVKESFKGDKILVYGPRPKKAYRKLKGHRSHYTRLSITEIIGG